MARADEVTDEQWKLIEKYLPARKAGMRGRRPRDPREVMNSVLWIMRTGGPWRDLPNRFPPYQTCHRHFDNWLRTGTLERVLNALARHLKRAERLGRASLRVNGDGRENGSSRTSWQRYTALALRSPYAISLRTRMKTFGAHPTNS